MKRSRVGAGILCGVVALIMSTSGCQRMARNGELTDSTEIRELEAMQKRGTDLRNASNFEDAIAVHDSCIEMAKAIHDTTQWIVALNNQGTNFRRLGALKEATELHYEALALNDAYSDTSSFNSKKNRVRSLNGLGNIFMSIGNYQAAETNLRYALQGETALGSATGQAINLANIGSIKQHEGQMDSARIYYQQSLEKNREADNIIGISLCYTYLGELDEKVGKTHDATDNFRKALNAGQNTGDVWHWLTPCISLAENFLTLQQADSAAKYIAIGVQAAEDIHSSEHLASLYGLRAQLEERAGLTGLALRDLQQSYAYRDSLLTQENRNAIQNNRVAYMLNRSTAVVEQAEKENKINRMIRNLTLGTSIVIVLVLVVFLLQLRRSFLIRRRAAAEREEFYRNMTHQLRTPLTVVVGMMDQLKQHVANDDQQGQEELDAAQRQGRHLLQLVKALIAGAREGINTDLAQNIPTDASGATPHSATASAYNTEHSGANILLAEDNEDVAILMCSILREQGYQVTHAIDGVEALEMLSDELPDLLITDIAMPRMDGLELMRRVREDDTMDHLPIMVVSARVEDHERLEGIRAGAEVYLAKPFINEELVLRVRKLLDQRALLRQRYGVNWVPTADTNPAESILRNDDAFLEALNARIEEQMKHGEINTSLLAEQLFISLSTLNRKLNNLTGLSASIYVRNRRLLAVKRMLEETDLTIAEIEAACGFNTVGYMGRLFRTELGCSPSEYRRKIKG